MFSHCCFPHLLRACAERKTHGSHQPQSMTAGARELAFRLCFCRAVRSALMGGTASDKHTVRSHQCLEVSGRRGAGVPYTPWSGDTQAHLLSSAVFHVVFLPKPFFCQMNENLRKLSWPFYFPWTFEVISSCPNIHPSHRYHQRPYRPSAARKHQDHRDTKMLSVERRESGFPGDVPAGTR